VVADAGPLNKKPRTDPKPKGDKKPTTREISVVATFPKPFKSVAEEVKAMKDDRWEPSTEDFSAVAGQQSVTVDNYLQLLAVALVDGNRETTAGSIGRINIFTHSNSDLIAMRGTISVGGLTTTVSLEVPTAISDDTLDALNQPGATFSISHKSKSISSKKYTLDDVRKRFAANAVIVLYSCRAGVSKVFLQRIADTFQVKVRGFDDVIGYFPTFVESPKPAVTNRRRVGIGHNSKVIESDFHKLDSHAKAVERSPQAPQKSGGGSSDDDE
jgi:hypothetical protein